MIDIQKVKAFLHLKDFSNYSILPVDEGFSTDVFKLVKDNNTLYLRILPLEENVETQYIVHKLLLEKGIKVPKVIYWERKVEILDSRDIMVVEEIKGKSVLNTEDELSNIQKEEILKEAGRELAKINMIEVKKYGDIYKVDGETLIGEYDRYEEYTTERVPEKMEELVKENVITEDLSKKVQEYIRKNKSLLHLDGNSYLSHGDFCLDHIYQLNGKYSGIIDFGDVRGTTKYRDLAQFYIFHRGYFDYLVKGYQEVYKLPSNYMDCIFLEALVFGIFKLNWVLKNRPERVGKSKVFRLFDRI